MGVREPEKSRLSKRVYERGDQLWRMRSSGALACGIGGKVGSFEEG